MTESQPPNSGNSSRGNHTRGVQYQSVVHSKQRKVYSAPGRARMKHISVNDANSSLTLSGAGSFFLTFSDSPHTAPTPKGPQPRPDTYIPPIDLSDINIRKWPGFMPHTPGRSDVPKSAREARMALKVSHEQRASKTARDQRDDLLTQPLWASQFLEGKLPSSSSKDDKVFSFLKLHSNFALVSKILG